MPLMPKHRTLRDCNRELLRQRPRRFEHICDEAEGCSWGLVTKIETPS